MDRRRWIFVALVALLVMAGVDVYSNGIGMVGEFNRAFSQIFDFKDTQPGIVLRTHDVDIPSVGVKRIVVDNVLGGVNVRGADTDTISIVASVNVSTKYAGSVAEEYAERSRVIVGEENGILRVSVEEPSHLLSGFGRKRVAAIQWSITVPRRLGVQVETEVGNVTVENVAGEVSVDAGFGDVWVRLDEAAPIDVSLNMGGVRVILSPDARNHDVELASNIGNVSVDSRYEWTAHEGAVRRSVRGTLGQGAHPLRVRVNIGNASLQL